MIHVAEEPVAEVQEEAPVEHVAEEEAQPVAVHVVEAEQAVEEE